MRTGVLSGPVQDVSSGDITSVIVNVLVSPGTNYGLSDTSGLGFLIVQDPQDRSSFDVTAPA
jgi:hypothetical protein